MVDDKSKLWYASKTLWINLIGVAAILVQHFTGKELFSMEVQASILAGINMFLRFITKSPIVWDK